jgi:small subunit ribosomal protein S4
MARYRGPRLRIIRRLGELPGLTSKTPKNQNPPGQHGASAKKLSQYGIRLQEKQKLRYHYGLNESQLIRYVRKARQLKGSTGDLLLQLLEMRLDNIVFRFGLAPTIPAARQLIRHGHVFVNNKRETVPSFHSSPQDQIRIDDKRFSLGKAFGNELKRGIPSFLNWDEERGIGLVKSKADRESVGLKLNELFIVEFYSRKV